MSMEQNGNQNLASPMFCRNGCGFYAAQAYDGMCSKCYKDLKQLQQNESILDSVQSPATTPSMSRSSLISAVNDNNCVDDVSVVMSKTSLGAEMNVNTSSNPNNDKLVNQLDEASGSGVNNLSSTLDTMKPSGREVVKEDVGGSGGSTGDSESEGEKGKKSKKNRCMECRKNVGLTGFICHCGKLLCSMHRYSDQHQCTYDFKEKGQEEIRKNNPVIKGEKIQRI